MSRPENERHDAEDHDGVLVCPRCGKTLNTYAETQQYCPGKGWHARWSTVPEHLKSVGQWAKIDKRPVKNAKVAARVLMYVYGQGHFWAALYDESQVTDIKRRKKVTP